MPSARDIAQFYLPLPVELIREIMKNVWPIDTLATLARVSKSFHNLVMPILYHSIHLWTEEDAESLITCIEAAHALSVDNAKYIVMLFFEPDMMECFDDVMSLPGLNPQTLFFETHNYGRNDVGQVASSWEARPKYMGVIKYSQLSHKNSWVRQRMALFSNLTHLYLDEVLDDNTLSFCLELRTLTHICLPICKELDSNVVLGQIHRLLGMASMELVLVHAAVREPGPEDPDRLKDQLNDMDFPKGDIFPLLAEIPDERLYVYPKVDVYGMWFVDEIAPWDLGRRHLTMPWREAVRVA